MIFIEVFGNDTGRSTSGRYWVIEATLTSAIEEKEKPSVINAALSAVEIEDFLVIFSSVMVAIFLKTNNNKLRTQ